MQNDINIIGTKELRNFGLIMAAMFSMVFGLLLPWLWNYSIVPCFPIMDEIRTYSWMDKYKNSVKCYVLLDNNANGSPYAHIER